MYMKLNNNLLNIKNTHSTSETDVYSANRVNTEIDNSTNLYKLYNNSNNTRNTEITLSDNYTNYKVIIVEIKMFDDYQNITIYSDQIGSGRCYLGDFSSSVNNRRISIGLRQNNKVYINFDDSNEGIIKAVYGQFKN